MDTTTPMFRRILLPTSLSKEEQEAFRMALSLSVAYRSAMTVLHVGKEHRDEVPWDLFPHGRTELEDWGLLPLGSAQQDVHTRLGITIDKRAMRGGNVVDAITEHLERHRTDLIVMATEGRNQLEQLLQPSVAGSIAHNAEAPSLVLPMGHQAPLRKQDGRLLLRRILIPVGPHAPVDRVVDMVADLAGRSCHTPVEITLLHVGANMGPLDRVATPAHPDLIWHRMLRTGPATETVVQVVRELNVDLVAMATEGHHRLLDRLTGTHTDRIRSTVPCPVLSVPVANGEA